MQYSCPTCDVPIGTYCMSNRGKPMFRYVHPDRMPLPDTEFTAKKIGHWLAQNAEIFT